MIRFCFIFAFGIAFAAIGANAAGAPGRDAGQLAGTTTVVRVDARTGRLVRTVAAPRIRTAAVEPVAYSRTVEEIAAEHSVPAELIHSVIEVESNYNPYAVSPKGALGMMQLIPATARRFGVANVFDPVENIQGGAKYLRYLLDLYNGDFRLALAAYNAGEQAVAKFGDVPPYPETRNYVQEVGRRVEARRRPERAKAPVSSAAAEAPAAPADPGPAHIAQIVESDGSVRYVSR